MNSKNIVGETRILQQLEQLELPYSWRHQVLLLTALLLLGNNYRTNQCLCRYNSTLCKTYKVIKNICSFTK